MMRTRMGLAVLMMLPALSRSAPYILDEWALRDECSANSQAGMAECLAKHVAASGQAVRDAERKLNAALARWDEDKKYVDLARKRFATAALAFQRSRDAQCEFAAALGGGAIGNALDIRRQACVAESNYLRARQIENALAELTNK